MKMAIGKRSPTGAVRVPRRRSGLSSVLSLAALALAGKGRVSDCLSVPPSSAGPPSSSSVVVRRGPLASSLAASSAPIRRPPSRLGVGSRPSIGDDGARKNTRRRRRKTTTPASSKTAAAPQADDAAPQGTATELRAAAAAAASASSPPPPSSAAPAQPQQKQRRRRVVSPSETSGARIQRVELVDHELLTKDEDLDLGSKVVRATRLRAAMAELVEVRRVQLAEEQRDDWARLEDLMMMEGEGAKDDDGNDGGWSARSSSEDDGADDLDGLASLYGSPRSMRGYPADEVDDDDLLLSESNGYTILSRERASSVSAAQRYVLVDEGSRFNADPIESDLRILTDEDAASVLGAPGSSREDLREALREGAEARERLLTCNMRLVVNISKKWIKRSDPGGSLSLTQLYMGGWDRPSLDEVVQEGFVGLARAADKYDPSRGLRFSTYATHWITSFVRLAFQRAATGCLRVPSQLHDIRNSYRKLMKRYESEEAPDAPVPGTQEGAEAIAKELGVTRNRLETALRVTESLVSIDQPVVARGPMHKGSGAGGDLGESELLLSDILKCREPRPDENVELSLLRNTLENAMSAELSPHERDVLRLRLGLEDGRTRTVREVVEVCGGGIRPADVRSAERRAFKKLRSPGSLRAHGLDDYLHVVGLAGMEYDYYNKRR